jgi:hypothetical protein
MYLFILILYLVSMPSLDSVNELQEREISCFLYGFLARSEAPRVSNYVSTVWKDKLTSLVIISRILMRRLVSSLECRSRGRKGKKETSS